MISSGMKRGLAATAVSALAVAGLPFLANSASATPLVEQYAPNALELYTGGNGTTAVGVRNDGDNTNVHLVSSGGSNVAQVRYSYSFGATTEVIGTVSRDNGVFSTVWTPAVNLYGQTVTITAQGLNNAGGEIPGASDTFSATVDANAATVDISTAPGAAVGVFQAAYAGHEGDFGVVSGTTSKVTGDVELQDQNDSIDDPIVADTYGTPANGARTFTGVVDFSTADDDDADELNEAYPFDTTDPKVDQAVVQAQVDSTDDNQAVTLYKQTISSVTAAATNANPPAGNPGTDVVVTVLDQNNKPIAGAEVVQAGGATKYTDSSGKAKFAVTGTPAGATFTYLVNVDDEDGYQDNKDYQRSVTVQTYSDAAGAITANPSALGGALDLGEYAASPVSITVTDNQNAPKNNQAVSYAWSVVPFAGGDSQPAGNGTVTSGADGKATIPAPTGAVSGTYTLKTYVEKDGNPGQSSGDLQSAPLTVKLGQASVVFADGNVAQAPVGGSKTFDAKLVLDDKAATPLPGREITFSYTPGNELDDPATPANEAGAGDSIVSATQPTGTTRINNNSAKDVTDATGTVSVSVTDPVENPKLRELNADLNAATTGDAADAAATNSPESLRVDWLKNTAPVDANDITVGVHNLFSYATPGRPVDLDITVENADGDELTDYPVTVSVDRGFLSNHAASINDLTVDPASDVEGGLFGEWKSEGTSRELTTDDNGNTGAAVAIEKDAGFETSDHVTTTVTIKAGGVTKTVPVTFRSDITPVNPGEVRIERAEASDQSVRVLPKAPTTEDVYYDVLTTDQFGNAVPNQSVELSDNLAKARMNGSDNDTTVNSQVKGNDPALWLSSEVAGDQTVTGTWTADTRVWTDGNSAEPGFQRELKQTDDGKTSTDAGETVNWYTIDLAKSTYTLSNSGAESQPVGSTVTMTYKAVDQNGEPIQGVDVAFFRAGPDDLQDGEGNDGDTTDENGEATYIFQGAKAGKAVVTAVPKLNGAKLPQVTDEVQFANPAKKSIALKVVGSSKGKNDRLAVNANDNGGGLKAVLYKNGKKVAAHKLNSAGNYTFSVKDTNGKKGTRYTVKVAESALTKAASVSKTVK